VTAPSSDGAKFGVFPDPPQRRYLNPVAKAFVADMRAFFAEPNAIKRDEIAARQAWLLSDHMPELGKKLRLTDVKEMFLQMRD
jgi:hypothetical protein